MKSISLMVFLMLFPIVGHSQDIKGRWVSIVPLHSTRADVEKLYGEPDDKLDSSYKTSEGNLKFIYAEERCVGTGWNVQPNTVLEYTVSPSESTNIDKVYKNFDKLSLIVDDAAYQYYTDIDKGLQYETDSRMEIMRIRHTPTKNDGNFRCQGFPSYSPLTEIYVPYSHFSIMGTLSNLPEIDDSLILINDQPSSKGYAYVYLKKGKGINEATRLVSKMRKFAYQKRKISPRKFQISFGGYREESEVEIFVLPLSYLAPVPSPKYAGHK